MPGPAPSPAHSCPPVPRATLAPAVQRGEGESHGFASVAVVWLCIFGLWEASLATRVLQALTASRSRYKKQATAFCRMQIAQGHPKKCTQEEGKWHRMLRTGNSSERGVWGPGLDAESDACCKTSAGNSAHRCPGSPFPMPPWVHAASAQQVSPHRAPTPANQTSPGLKTSLGVSLVPGTILILCQLLSSPGCSPLHRLPVTPLTGESHQAEFGGAPGRRGAEPAGPAPIRALRARLDLTGTHGCSCGSRGANQHCRLG